MEFGMSTACFYGADLNEDALAKIGDMGIPNAEIFFAGMVEYEPSFVRTLRNVARDNGVAIRSVHALTTQFEPQLFTAHPRQFDEAMDLYCKVLEAAHTLGASVYVFHGPAFLKKARRMKVNFEAAGERFSMLADIAAEYGVRLCYETVHWCWYQYPDFAARLLEHVASDNLRFTLDMKQAAQSGYDCCEYIDRMGGRLAHVHACDYRVDAEGGIEPALPMEGQADWSALRAKLEEIGYDDLVMLEVYAMNYDSLGELYDSYERVKRFFEEKAGA